MYGLLTGVSGLFHNILEILLLLFVFAIVVALAYFSTKFIARFQGNVFSSKGNIKVVESMRLNSNVMLLIAKVGDEYYLLGVQKDGVTMLDKLSPDQLDLSHLLETSDVGSTVSFKEIFNKIKNKSKDDDTP